MARIHTNRKSGFIQRGGVMRRESLWVANDDTETVIGAANSAVLFGGFTAAVLDMRPFTIVRNRGFWHIRSDQGTASETQAVSFAFSVVSDEALAVGVTAVPTPGTGKESDLFFVFETLLTALNFGSAIGVQHPFGVGAVYDSKAMRKVEDGQDIAQTIQTEGISDGVVVQKTGRMLIKLH